MSEAIADWLMSDESLDWRARHIQPVQYCAPGTFAEMKDAFGESWDAWWAPLAPLGRDVEGYHFTFSPEDEGEIRLASVEEWGFDKYDVVPLDPALDPCGGPPL